MFKHLSAVFCLIHNRTDRTESALEQLKELANDKAEEITATVSQFSFQPDIVPHSKALAWRRKLIYRKLAVKWAKYRGVNVGSQKFRREFSFYRRSLKSWFKERHLVTSWQTQSAIEVNVTDKHVRGWIAFLEADADFVVMSEDDAVFDTDTSATFGEVIELVREYAANNTPMYMDLAGGCRLQDLGIDLLKGDIISNRFRKYKKPVTNTACCYLLSRKLAEIFLAKLIEHPEYRTIGVDWMMNQLFIDIFDDGVVVKCFHAEPPIIRHGSVTGDFVSMIR